MTAPLLKAEGLSCERDYRVLFEGLNMRLEAGQILQLTGQNGAGKTSLLRGLYGLNTDLIGRIEWFQQPWPASRHQLMQQSVFLGHHTGVNAYLSARENLRWYSDLRGAVDASAIEQALAAVGLEGYEDIACHQLSAGQQRRVALARLELSKARIWLLDEPFTAIDKTGVSALEQRIQDFAAAGGAVLLTSHHSLQPNPYLSFLDIEAYCVSA